MGKKALLYGGVAVLAVLLIGAAFVGGQLLSGGDVGRFVPPFLRGGGTTYYSGEVIHPEELPEELPTDGGEVMSVTGKKITIRRPAGSSGAVYYDEGGERREEGEWKDVEVLVTRNTKIWKTQPIEMSPGKAPEEPIKQEVEEATLEDIKPGDHINAWGTKSGDRITAEVIQIMGGMGVMGTKPAP